MVDSTGSNKMIETKLKPNSYFYKKTTKPVM